MGSGHLGQVLRKLSGDALVGEVLGLYQRISWNYERIKCLKKTFFRSVLLHFDLLPKLPKLLRLLLLLLPETPCLSCTFQPRSLGSRLVHFVAVRAVAAVVVLFVSEACLASSSEAVDENVRVFLL